MRALALVGLLLLALSACTADAPAPSDGWSITRPVRDAPPDLERAEGRTGPNGGRILQPSSVPIESGVPYRFTLGHCGLASPVDFDGSFWDAVDGVDGDGAPLELEADGEMINATEGIIAVVGDEARFRTVSGSVVRFDRHLGEKEFPLCD